MPNTPLTNAVNKKLNISFKYFGSKQLMIVWPYLYRGRVGLGREALYKHALFSYILNAALPHATPPHYLKQLAAFLSFLSQTQSKVEWIWYHILWTQDFYSPITLQVQTNVLWISFGTYIYNGLHILFVYLKAYLDLFVFSFKQNGSFKIRPMVVSSSLRAHFAQNRRS